MEKEIIVKYLNNDCTTEEINEVVQWINTEAINSENKNKVFDIWKNFQVKDNTEDDKKFSILFDKIQKRIDTKALKENTAQNKKSTFSLIISWVTKVAAILLLPVVGFLFYTLSVNDLESMVYANTTIDSLEVIAPVGSRTLVQLSDGSEVHLNYGSKIKYPRNFIGDTREVELQGEAFFNVSHNPDKPFIVKTDQMHIKALGTAFNVFAYPEQDAIETTLVSGKVVLNRLENGKFKSIGAMVPGQHVKYSRELGLITSSEGNIEKYIAWKDGKIIFEDATIIQVAENLSRMFNVDIKVRDEIKDFIYTVTFVDEPLFQILELMTIATPVSYEALPRKKLPDGTFSKQKIIIKKRQ